MPIKGLGLELSRRAEMRCDLVFVHLMRAASSEGQRELEGPRLPTPCRLTPVADATLGGLRFPLHGLGRVLRQ